MLQLHTVSELTLPNENKIQSFYLNSFLYLVWIILSSLYNQPVLYGTKHQETSLKITQEVRFRKLHWSRILCTKGDLLCPVNKVHSKYELLQLSKLHHQISQTYLLLERRNYQSLNFLWILLFFFFLKGRKSMITSANNWSKTNCLCF